MKLFEYAVIYHPRRTKKDEDEGVMPKDVLVDGINTTLANSDREVSMLAARGIPEEYTDKLDQIEILVRPF